MGAVVWRLWSATDKNATRRADVEFHLIQKLMRYAIHIDCRTAHVMEQTIVKAFRDHKTTSSVETMLSQCASPILFRAFGVRNTDIVKWQIVVTFSLLLLGTQRHANALRLVPFPQSKS